MLHEVHSAIHVRTGQRSAGEAVDAWLAGAGVRVLPFDDPYAACAHLLRHSEQIPDIAAVGADWLAEDECRLVCFVRQTWPRTGILVYGAARDVPLFDFQPLTLTCRGTAALRRLLAHPPTELLARLHGQAVAARPIHLVRPEAAARDDGAPPATRVEEAAASAGQTGRAPDAALDELRVALAPAWAEGTTRGREVLTRMLDLRIED